MANRGKGGKLLRILTKRVSELGERIKKKREGHGTKFTKKSRYFIEI